MGKGASLRASIASAALLLAGCSDEPAPDANKEAARGLLRAELANRCMENLPEGPRTTRYNDWDEVVEACSSTAYYQSNHCEDPALCLRAMFPEAAQAMSASGQDPQGLGAKPASAVRKDAP